MMSNVKKYRMDAKEIETMSKNLGLGIGKVLKIDPDRVDVTLKTEDTVILGALGAAKFRAEKVNFTVDKKLMDITATQRQEIAGVVLNTHLPMRVEELKRLKNDKTVL